MRSIVSGANAEALLAFEIWRDDAHAEDGVDDVNRYGAVKIAAAPLEPGIPRGPDDDKEITARRA